MTEIDRPVPPVVPATGLTAVPTARPELPPAAQRALAEAEERRRAAAELALPKELRGRDGPEPIRYGDWEVKGIASDF